MSLKRTGSQTAANKGISVAMAGGGGSGGITLSSVYVTDSSYVALTPSRTAVSTSGGYVSLLGTGFSANNKVYVQGVTATSVSYVSSTQINAQLPAYNTSSQSVQQIYVVNPQTNSAGILVTGFLYSVMPYWTAATSQSAVGPIISISLAALSDSALSYSISSGTLPTGVTLNTSTGVISGVTNTATSTTIVVYAVDQETQTNTQTFTITVIIGDQQFAYTTSMLNNETTVLPFNRDASNNTFDIAVLGDTRPSNVNPYSNGYYSNLFNGTTDYLTTPSNLAFAFGTSDFTIEAWIYTTTTASTQRIISNTNNNEEFLLVNSGANIYLDYYDGVADFTSGSSYILAGIWTHVAVSRTSNTIKLFINGTQVGTGSSTANHTVAQTVYVGRYGGSAINYFNGYISNLRIVKGSAVYTAAFTPPTAPLTATAGTGTVLLTCQSPNFIDAGPIANTITRTGAPQIQSFNPFASTSTVTVPTLYSVKFNGSSDYLTTTSPNFSSTGDLTLEGWAYITSGSTYQGIASMRDSGGTTGGGIVVNNTGNLEFAIAGVFYNSTACPLNQWFHVALVRSGSSTNNCSCYVNGNRVGQFTSTGQINGASNVLIIGRYYANGTNQYFTSGNISNIRYIVGTAIYSGATYTVPTSPLTAIAGTVLLTCQTATLIDNSTNTSVITSVGSAQPFAVTPFTQSYTSQAVTTLGSSYFDGTGDYLSIPASSALVLGGDFTIECWVYTGTVSGNQGIIASSGQRFGLIRLTNYFYWLGSTDLSGSSITINTNTWYHVAVSRSGSTLKLFVNGVQANSGTYSEASTSNVWYVGSDQSNEVYNGYLADIRIIKGVALYTANFAPPAAPLTPITNTSLLTVQSNQAVNNSQFLDNSSNNFLITRTGNVSNGTFNPFGANFSNYFNGSTDYLSVPNNAAFNIGTGNFTLECWVYLTAFTSPGTAIFGTFPASGTITGYALTVGTTGALGFSTYVGGPVQQVQILSNVISLNTWNHIAVVNNSGIYSIYVNGVSYSLTGSISQSVTTGGNSIKIGALLYTGNNDYLLGYISNLRLVTSAVYSANFTPPTAPLTAITGTVLLTCQSPSFRDNSGNAFALTITGTPTVQKFSPFSNYVQTPLSYATKFNGTTDYITLPSGNPALQLTSNDFTLEAWVYPLAFVANGNPIFALDVNGSWYASVRFGYESAGAISLAMSTTGAAWAISISSGLGTVVLNTWQHVAVSRSGTSVRVFLNGVQQGAVQTVSGSLMTSTNNWIGYLNAPSTQYVNGYISNARIIKGTAVYTANFAPSTTPLTAISGTALLTCQDATLKDNSTNQFAITATGSPTPKTFNPFGLTTSSTQPYSPAVYGSSAYFDGSGDYFQLGTAASSAVNALAVNKYVTIDFWVNTQAIQAITAYTTDLFGQAPGIVQNGRYFIQLQGSSTTSAQTVIFWWTDSGSTAVQVVTTNSIVQKTWNHIAITLDMSTPSSTTIKIYINGVAETFTGKNLSTHSSDNGNPTYLGAVYAGANQSLTGYLANFRFSKSLVYTNNFVPPAAPVTSTPTTVFLLSNTPAIVDNTMLFNFETAGDAKLGTEQPYAGSYYSNYFNGSSDYFTVPANSALSMGTGDFTWEMWVYPITAPSGTSTLSNQMLFGYRSGSDTSPYLSYNAGVGGTNLNVAFEGDTTTFINSSVTLALNQWSHLAVSRFGTALKMFINGVVVGSVTNSTNFSDASLRYIGAMNSTPYYFPGYISNLRIVKGTAVYTAAFTPSTAPLTAITNTALLTCQTNKFIDNSANNFTLTLSGTPQVKTYNPFQRKSGQSMYFDGTGDYMATAASPVHDFGAGAFTIEMWIYPTLAATQQVIAFHGWSGSGANNYGWNAQINTSNQLAFYANGTLTAFTDLVVNFNSWNYITFVGTGGVLSAYKNGVKSATTYTYTSIVDRPTMNLVIGGWNNNTENIAERLFYNGYIDDFRITKGVARYTATFTPPTTALPAL